MSQISASRVFVVAQVAVAFVMLATSTVLLRSFIQVTKTPLGFEAAKVVQFRLRLPAQYVEKTRNLELQARLLDAVEGLAGVSAVTLIGDRAVGSEFRSTPFVTRKLQVAGDFRPLVYINLVSAEYFKTLGIRLLDGRLFERSDGDRSRPALVVDEKFAELYFHGERVIDQEVALGPNPPPPGIVWPKVVGVVARANLTGMEGQADLPFIYYPIIQQPKMDLALLVRSERNNADIIAEIRKKIIALDPFFAIYDVMGLETAVDNLLIARRCVLWLVCGIAALAVFLASIGLYGTVAYDIARRSREIAICRALGASSTRVFALVMIRPVTNSVLGLFAGTVLYNYLLTYIARMLADTFILEPFPLVLIGILLLAVTIISSLGPLIRALRISPMIALRNE